jgi:hypothetical protein
MLGQQLTRIFFAGACDIVHDIHARYCVHAKRDFLRSENRLA